MKPNVSEMIREFLSESPVSSLDILEGIGNVTTIKRLRGILGGMHRLGMINKLGEEAPYVYTIARKTVKKYDKNAYKKEISKRDELPYTIEDVDALKDKLDFNARQRSQLIRQAIKLLPMRPMHIAMATGLHRKHVSGTISDMLQRGYVKKREDGCYEFVKSPKNEAIDTMRNMSIGSQKPAKVDAWKDIEAETVEEFIARGGVIDRTPYRAHFENLKHEDIEGKSTCVPVVHLLQVRSSSSHF